MKLVTVILTLIAWSCVAMAQQENVPQEKRVALTETAVALDSTSNSALEATLVSSDIHGTADSAVTNIRLTIKNSSHVSYAFASGIVTFYDNAGVRCGEGLFKAEALAPNESFETDTPGIRIRCTPATWRIVATSVIPRVVPMVTPTLETPSARLLISVDGEEHPIQLGKPMTLSLSNKPHTIVVSQKP